MAWEIPASAAFSAEPACCAFIEDWTLLTDTTATVVARPMTTAMAISVRISADPASVLVSRRGAIVALMSPQFRFRRSTLVL